VAVVDDALDVFAVLMTTKLIGAAERSSVQGRLRSLPQLRQASATLAAAGPGPAAAPGVGECPGAGRGGPGRAGIDPTPYSAHSLRAGFVTNAHLRGASDRAIAHQTRHRSLATLDGYVRVHTASADNAATQLGL